MEKVTFHDWDPSEEIENGEEVIAYLEEAFMANDPEFLQRTISYIARSKGMTQLVENSNDKPAEYSPAGEISFSTVVKILDNLGYRISIQQKKAS